MLFNSFEFLVFLPVVFLLYWFVFKNLKQQNLLIVISSYIFYGWWDYRFLTLIIITSLCGFYGALLIKRFYGTIWAKIICWTNVILNLTILGVFKYYNFFVESLESLLGTFGLTLNWTTLNIILPIGISFYTFQALSYTIDVYRKDIDATHDIIAFFAYISFFPQLVAGPIERATNLLPQFQKNRDFNYFNASDGCRQMLWGLFKKVVVADHCASLVNNIWANFSDLSGFTLLIGCVCFSIQIYCDFSGYSDIAIGCAKLFGFNLMRNFNYPYFSRNIPEFWRRWHISLTTWFRDYIYIPLGGSRGRTYKTIRNIVIIWIISGLWHGAQWTFICWGLYHALALSISNILRFNRKYHQIVAFDRSFPSVKEFFQMLFTFSIVSFGWILFRAENMGTAMHFINTLLNSSIFDIRVGIKQLSDLYWTKAETMMVVLFILVEWCQRNQQHGLQFTSNRLTQCAVIRYAVYVVLSLMILCFPGAHSDFIYFQF